MSREPKKAATPPLFFAVSPLMLFPQTSGEFEVWLKQDDDFVLYTQGHDGFTDNHRQSLHDHGVEEVWVHTGQREVYQQYVEDNLGNLLNNQALPVKARAKVLYDASLEIVKDAFESRLPEQPDPRHFERIVSLVDSCTDFLARKDSLKNLSSMISHDYKTYSHSLNVMIFSLAILDSLELDRDRLIEVALGAILHDIGKTGIPREILDKPGRLNADEWDLMKRHPTRGVALCANIPLSQLSIHTIMFHHEHLDGKGYPAGLTGSKIPIEVRAVTLADVYDALTSDRPYANRVTPFQALRIMQDEMEEALDEELYKQLVVALSGAGIMTDS